MTLYDECLAMDETIVFVDNIASEEEWRASELQLQISSDEQFFAYEDHLKNEKQYERISKWLEQLQKVYEIIDNYDDEDIEGKDSIGAFLKIYDVIKMRQTVDEE